VTNFTGFDIAMGISNLKEGDDIDLYGRFEAEYNVKNNTSGEKTEIPLKVELCDSRTDFKGLKRQPPSND
jgi:hypothetical protein